MPFNGNVTVTLPDGSTQIAEIVDGSGDVIWSIPEDYNGTYTYTVDYEGNDAFLPSNATGSVDVIPKVHVHIIVTNVTTYPDLTVDISIEVTADDSSPFNGDVVVTMPDVSTQTVRIADGVGSILQASRFNILAAATIGSGTATWHVPASYAPGNYPVLAEFEGNDDYFAATGEGNIEVLSVPTNITVSVNVTGKAGQNVTIPIDVATDDNKPFNGNVTVSLPDGSNQTVEIVNGTGSATWSIPEDYNGNYSYTVNCPGNESYLASNATGSITVIPKVHVNINVDNITAYPNENVSVPIEFTADDGEPVNANVTITLDDGSTQTVEIIDGKGNVSWTVPEKPGNYTFAVSFDGDDNYFPSNGTGTVNVVKVPVDIIVDNVTAKPGDDVNITVKVIPQDGSDFNGEVTVVLPDRTQKVVEIINGEGSVTWTIPEDYEGNYTVKVIFNGSDIYYPANYSGNGIGVITVVPEAVPAENETAAKHVDIKTENNATGNPILALLMVLALLGLNIKRRK